MMHKKNTAKDHLKHYLKHYLSDYHEDILSYDIEDREIYKIFLNQENESKPLCNKLEAKMGYLKDKMVLDVGCGPGGRSVALALKGARVIGLEPIIEGAYASMARSAQYSNIDARFLIGIGEKLPFKNSSFDLVTMFYVLEHTMEMDKVLSESYRALKNGGYLYCELPNHLFPKEDHYGILWFPLMPKWFNRAYFKLRGKNPKGFDDTHCITRKNMIRSLKQIGFNEIEDVNIDYVKERINNPQLIVNLARRKVVHLLKRLKLHKIFSFFVVKLALYPSIHLIAKKK